MNAGLLWVGLPLLTALGLAFWPHAPTRRKRWVAATVAALLAFAAWQVPIDRMLPLLGYRWTWTLTSEWHLLGRGFVLDNDARPWLLALYAWTALAALLSAEARLAPDFPSWALALPGFFTAALAARDFLLTVLLLGLGLPLLVFLWLPPQRPHRGNGAGRYLARSVLGLLLLLLALQRLPGLETAAPETPAVLQNGLLLAMGLALWAGVVPFHTDYPLLGQQVHPFRLAFGGWLSHFVLVWAVLRWAPSFVWLRQNPTLQGALQGLGLGTLALAGVLLWAQRDIGRLTGYLLLFSTGWSWLALAHGDSTEAIRAFLTLAWPRALLWIGWAWAVSVLGLPHDTFHERHLAGRGRAAPWTAALMLLGLGAWAPWPGLGLPAWALLPPNFPAWGWVALAIAFGGVTFAVVRWAQILFLNERIPEPNLPEGPRERLWAVALLLLWLWVAFTPGLWYAWATAAYPGWP